ncbi:MAG: IS110 family transposase, partial [Bacteroidales bacterium]|nr:IS110 family transposase [Bacteroidales bacterium]
MKVSIGIDVSMDTLDVALYDGKSHKILRCENRETGFSEIEKELIGYDRANILISMEATGIYHLKMAVYFHERGYSVSVLNPLIMKRYTEMKMLRAKTDSVDARAIAEYGYTESPCYFNPKKGQNERITQLLKLIDGLHRTKSEIRNRFHALKRVPGADETALLICEELETCINAEIRQAEQKINQILKEYYSDDNKRLREIPGVGERLSSLVIGFFGKFENFDNAKQVSSFIGLNPSPRQSGISLNGRGIISKKGNRYIRKIFYMAALSASKHNSACKAQYERLLENGKSKRVALIAVANKLARQIFAV